MCLIAKWRDRNASFEAAGSLVAREDREEQSRGLPLERLPEATVLIVLLAKSLLAKSLLTKSLLFR
jgi:hypothetical protein